MTTKTSMSPAVLARRFQALSDQTRLAVVELLRGGERCVCDLADALDVGQSLLSFHLKTLREAELVRARREGRWMRYSLAPETLEELSGVLERAGREAAARTGVADGCCGS